MDQLAALDVQIVGPLDQFHIYPWSTAIRIPTNQGTSYFKASVPALAHEAALMQELTRRRPDLVPRLLAADDQRGWFISGDAGRRVDGNFGSDSDILTVERTVAAYAELQRELSAEHSVFLKFGLPDRRLSVLPGLYEELLHDTRILGLGQSWGIQPEEYQLLKDRVPAVIEVCEQLSRSPVPESIDHGDFHLRHFYLKNRKIRLLDWGDSSITHPFVSLRPTFETLNDSQSLADQSSVRKRLLESYLFPWRQAASIDKLVHIFDLAYYVSWIIAVLRWQRATSDLAETAFRPYRQAIPGKLRRFLALSADFQEASQSRQRS